MNRMNKDLKDRWVAALRSGKYKQTTGRLRSNDNSYCCLGVLCDVIQPEGWDELYWKDISDPEVSNDETGLGGAYVPNITAERIGLTNQVTLSSLNDLGSGFEVIAYYIEANL